MTAGSNPVPSATAIAQADIRHMSNPPHKTALLVGAKRVGRQVAIRLAEAGYHIAIAYRSSRSEAEETAQLIAHNDATNSIKTTTIQADITQPSDVERAVEHTVEELGSIYATVNLASDYPRTPFSTLSADQWDSAMSAAKGSYLLGVNAARAMASNPGPVRGHIVFFGDWAAEQTPYTDYLPYLTAKAAIHFMTRALAAETAPLGVRVNCIAPGPTMRPPDISQEEWDAAILENSPLQQQSSADDIADIVATLLGTSSVTGETIRIDSGRHIRGV